MRRFPFAVSLLAVALALPLGAQSIVYQPGLIGGIVSSNLFGQSLAYNSGDYNFYSTGFSAFDPANHASFVDASSFGQDVPATSEFESYAHVSYNFADPQPAGGKLLSFGFNDLEFGLDGSAGTAVHIDFLLHAYILDAVGARGEQLVDPVGVTSTNIARFYVYALDGGLGFPLLIFSTAVTTTQTLGLDLILDPSARYLIRAMTEATSEFGEVAAMTEERQHQAYLTWTTNVVGVTATPEPASFTLLATGLAGVFGASRRRKLGARSTD